MKIPTTVALVVFLLTSAAFSQSNRDKPEEGSYGLIFFLSGFKTFGPGDYQGVPVPGDTTGLFGGFGFRYYFSPTLAARLGLGFRSSSTTEKPGPGASPSAVDETSSMTLFSIAPGLQFTLMDLGAVRGYAGFQLGLISVSVKYEGVDHIQGDSQEITRWLYSGGGFLGAEWFFADRLSLGVEYNLQYVTRSGKNKATYSGTTNEYDLDVESWLDLKSGSSVNLLLNIML